MRNPEPKSFENERIAASPSQDGWAARTPADLSSLLLELARALRGFAFYKEADAQRRPLLDRAFRAVSSELTRAGAIDLRLDQNRFKLAGLSQTVEASGVLADLDAALTSHGLYRLRFDGSLTSNALGGLFDLLGQPSARFTGPDRFARALAARDAQGLQLNDIEYCQQKPTRKLTATPPRASASLASSLSPDSTHPRSTSGEAPSLNADPLGAPSADDRGERLRARLIELDRTVEDEAYDQQAGEIVGWARDLAKEGLPDEAYRALLVLADHAVGSGGRPETQARIAANRFAELAVGEQLNHLINRATEPGGPGVRAAQLLLQLGPKAVLAIVDLLCVEDRNDRSGPLRALVLALGEASLPALLEAIAGSDERRARVGIRLAGELQNPAALPALLKAMRAPEHDRQIETIRALGFLPVRESKDALAGALASDNEEIAVAAAHALATCEGGEAVLKFLDVLDASMPTTRTRLSRTLVRLLGQLGDERAVPRLSAILERKPILRRTHHHAIQLAVIDALAILPTKEARRSIERAAQRGAKPVSDRAKAKLIELSASR
jgi:HEAT repeat protein